MGGVMTPSVSLFLPPTEVSELPSASFHDRSRNHASKRGADDKRDRAIDEVSAWRELLDTVHDMLRPACSLWRGHGDLFDHPATDERTQRKSRAKVRR
jgi:hypothetical protein